MAIKKSLSHVSVDHTLIVQRDPWLDTQYLFPSIGSYLSLVTEERRKLESVITKSLSTEILNKIARLQDRTNQCQSLHHRVFIYAPKFVLCKRNSNGHCHSACHSSTFGMGKSSVLIANSLGLNFTKCAPIFRFMTRRDILAVYHSQREKTLKY